MKPSLAFRNNHWNKNEISSFSAVIWMRIGRLAGGGGPEPLSGRRHWHQCEMVTHQWRGVIQTRDVNPGLPSMFTFRAAISQINNASSRIPFINTGGLTDTGIAATPAGANYRVEIHLYRRFRASNWNPLKGHWKKDSILVLKDFYLRSELQTRDPLIQTFIPPST